VVLMVSLFYHVRSPRGAWGKAFFLNPLEVDWMRFEVHDTQDMDYLISAIEVLQDMQDLWINDTDTRDQSITRLFILFTRALKRLLMYTGFFTA
jgi:hypothetical protein